MFRRTDSAVGQWLLGEYVQICACSSERNMHMPIVCILSKRAIQSPVPFDLNLRPTARVRPEFYSCLVQADIAAAKLERFSCSIRSKIMARRGASQMAGGFLER